MTAPVVPRVRVTAPPAPLPHLFGLLSASTVIDNVEGHELTGVEYEALCGPRVDPYPASCLPLPDGVDRRKIPQRTTAVAYGGPFALYAADDCALGRDQAAMRSALRARFLAAEQRTLEEVVRTGAMGNSPSLEHDAHVIDATEVYELGEGIAQLERWLSHVVGGQGVIHAPAWVAPALGHPGLITIAGPKARTFFGSTWAFGMGYTGGPPEDYAGAADEWTWLYATAPVTVRRSSLIEPAGFTSGAWSTAQNTAFLVVERNYVVDWPCLVGALRVELRRPPPLVLPSAMSWTAGAADADQAAAQAPRGSVVQPSDTD